MDDAFIFAFKCDFAVAGPQGEGASGLAFFDQEAINIEESPRPDKEFFGGKASPFFFDGKASVSGGDGD